MYYFKKTAKQIGLMRALVLLLMLVLFLPGCGGGKVKGLTVPAISKENHNSAHKTPLYTDKFDEKLYKELGPFTARPNALFIPGDNIPRPEFIKNVNSITNKRDGREQLNCPDIAGLVGCVHDYDYDKEADQLDRTGTSNSWEISDNIHIYSYFPKNLKNMAIAEIGAGMGYYIHSWTRLVGTLGKVYLVDLDPFSIGFMEYKISMEYQNCGEKSRIILVRNNNNDPCLPKNKIKLIYAQALHAYITQAPAGMPLVEYEKACQNFWKAIENAMIYSSKDPARLIIFDQDYNLIRGKIKFTSKEAINRILKYTHLNLIATDNNYQPSLEGFVKDGWVAVFVKTRP